MAIIKVRYLTKRTNEDGTCRYYWQPNAALKKAGFKLETLPEDETQAITRAQELNAAVDEWRNTGVKKCDSNAPVTVRDTIARYQDSRHWHQLSLKTRKDYQYALNTITAWAGDAPMSALTPKTCTAFYESMRARKDGEKMIETPAKAAAVMRVLRLVLSFAMREGLIRDNPASRMKLSSKAKKGRLWTPAEVAAFVAIADDLGYYSLGSAVMLNEWLGQRKGDIIALQASAWRDGCIFIRQSKRGAEVQLPVEIIPALSARLQEQRRRFPDSPALFPNEDGKPMTTTTMRKRFEEIRAKAAKDNPVMADIVFKTLRHTAITRLAEAGCDTPLIASITGHSMKTCESIIDIYLVRTARMAREAFSKRQAYEAASLFDGLDAAGSFPVETPAQEQNAPKQFSKDKAQS